MRKKLLISTISITILIIITTIGFTYSFFSTAISGSAKNNTVTVGTLQLQYTDQQQASLTNAYPGDTITKIISVSNTGTLATSYDIIYKNLINQIEQNELTISYTCASYTGYVNKSNKGTASGTCSGKSTTAVPYSTTSINRLLTEDIFIDSGITHEYTITITFKETTASQNYNQGKSFSAIISITAPNEITN